MSRNVMHDLQDQICDICNKLSTENKLITTKSVLSILHELIPEEIDDVDNIDNVDAVIKENVASAINLWRISKVEQLPIKIEQPLLTKATQPPASQSNYNHNKQLNNQDSHQLNQRIVKYRKQIINAKRQIRFLKAKIKVLNSFYNRQRQEFIMRIEGMLYK